MGAIRILIGFFLVIFLGATVLSQGEDRIQDLLGEGRQAINLGDVVLETDFATDDANWQSVDIGNRFVGIENDAYRIEHTTLNTPHRGLYDETFANTVIVVETTQLSTELDNGYGVICRADPEVDNSGYYFFISGDGFAQIFTYENFRQVSLEGWVSVGEINQGQSTNEIIVVCDNTYLALYVNGSLIVETESDIYSEGQIGFAASTYVSQAPISINYDNLRVFDASGGAEEIEPEFPETLENHNGAWQDAIAELQDEGMIASGGNIIFVENSAFLDGTVGSNFYGLAMDSSFADIVLAGEIEFAVDETEDNEIFCGFLSRVQLDETQQFSEASFGALIGDFDSIVISTSDTDSYREELIDLDLPPDEPAHLLYILQDNRATVYVNGELVLSDYLISDVAGFHGIILASEVAGTRCEGRNVWAYYAPMFEAGVCEASTGSTVNQRTGPGTTFDRAGTLAANTSILVTGQAEGADGFTWWQLENENWVREDVVGVVGDCADIRTVIID